MTIIEKRKGRLFASHPEYTIGFLRLVLGVSVGIAGIVVLLVVRAALIVGLRLRLLLAARYRLPPEGVHLAGNGIYDGLLAFNSGFVVNVISFPPWITYLLPAR